MAGQHPIASEVVDEQSAPTITVTPEQIQSQFDLGIALALTEWPALTISVQNLWGGPDSADKRDWLAGALSDLFANRPDADAGDVEEMLLQVMQDEFDVNLEDDSEVLVAQLLVKLRKETAEGDFSTVQELHAKWLQRKGRNTGAGSLQVVEHAHDREDDGDEDESEAEDEEDEEDEDVEMADAEPQSTPRKKPEPEVDADGFTTVVSKKRR